MEVFDVDGETFVYLQIKQPKYMESIVLRKKDFIGEAKRISDQNLVITKDDYAFLKNKSIKGISCLPDFKKTGKIK